MTESQKLDELIGRLSYFYHHCENPHERAAVARAIDKLLARKRETERPVKIRWRESPRITWK